MKRARRGQGQRGSVLPIIAFVSVILAVLGFGGAVLGRVVAARQDAQRAADGAAVAAADLIREHGLPAQLPRALEIGQFSNRAALGFDPRYDEEPTRLVTSVAASGQIEAWRFVWQSGRIDVGARARATVGQEIHIIDNWAPPFVALVLDYSGSMAENFGNRTKIDALEDAVRRMFDSGFRIEFAATLFDSAIVGTEEFGADSVGRIRHLLESHGPGSATCTSCGLRSGHELLDRSPDTGADRFVILVSDGAPNDGGGEEGARAEAQRLWHEGNASIFALHVGGGGGLQAFMESVSGTPDHHPYPEDYYFQVNSPEQMQEALEAIAAAIACRTPRPLNMAAIEDLATLRVFLREGGRERRLEETNHLGAGNAEGYQLEQGSGRLRFTPRACNAIIDRGAQIVVRYNRARLIQ